MKVTFGPRHGWRPSLYARTTRAGALLAALLLSSVAPSIVPMARAEVEKQINDDTPSKPATIELLSTARREIMTGVSWRPGCPVALDELRLLTLNFRDFSGAAKRGELIVHHTLAKDVVHIFDQLFADDFRIARMAPIEDFAGNDDASMAANNTSAFNCRPVSGRRGGFSRHAYGVAVDVNPQTNPFVRKGKISPPGGEAYLDRSQQTQGLIRKNGPAWTAFVARGFKWGGSWRSLKDYQHFQHARPAAPEKSRKFSVKRAPKASTSSIGSSSPAQKGSTNEKKSKGEQDKNRKK